MGRAAASAHALWLRSRCWLLRNALCLRSLRVVLFAAAAAAVAVAAVATAAAAAVAATAAACFSGPISRRRRHSRVARCCSSCLSLSARVRRVCFSIIFCVFFNSILKYFKKRNKATTS